jgi:hypothetical protein
MAIVGTARLTQMQALDPEAAWRAHHQSLGLTRAEFDTYLDGNPRAYLLLLHRVFRLNEPLPLRKLREEGPVRPPQSFRFIAESDPRSLLALVALANPPPGDRGETGRPGRVKNPAVRRSTPPGSSPAITTRGKLRHHPHTSKIADS